MKNEKAVQQNLETLDVWLNNYCLLKNLVGALLFDHVNFWPQNSEYPAPRKTNISSCIMQAFQKFISPKFSITI